MGEFRERLFARARELGFDLVGAVGAEAPPDYARYQAWVRDGFAAGMGYMAEAGRAAKRGDLSKVLPGVRSVIVGGFSYAPADQAHLSDAKFARYGWGEDYHVVVREKLEALIAWMREHASEPFDAKAYVDTGPILERSLAERAGIGWIGKNTCVIHQEKGSYLYLGEILTTLALDPSAKAINHCGTCTRCLDACPTRAIEAPYRLNAEKCISYHTLENRKSDLPAAIAAAARGWVAGCDICQEVCPWNGDVPSFTIPAFAPLPHAFTTRADLGAMDEGAFAAKFAGTAFARTGLAKLRRTVAQTENGE